MKIYLIIPAFVTAIMLSSSSFSEQVYEYATCLELDHADGQKRNICDKNDKKFLVIEFFLPGCPACHKNAPQFKKLESEIKPFAHSRLISLKDLQQTIPFIRRHRITSEVALDNAGLAKRAFNIRSVPTTIIIDENNQIIERIPGFLNDQVIARIKNTVAKTSNY